MKPLFQERERPMIGGFELISPGFPVLSGNSGIRDRYEQSNQSYLAMTLEFLSNKELSELTEYQRKAEQCSELARLGINFKVSRSGRPLVLRQTVMALLGGKVLKEARLKEPDLDALEKVK